MAVLDHYVQGSFTADGNAHILNIPSDCDYMEVENMTRIITPQNGTGVKFRWYYGMVDGYAIQENTDGSGVMTISQVTSNGFTQLNTADPQTPGAQLSGTAISNAATPIASSSNTGSLANGSIVRLYNIAGGNQFEGMDFSVSSVTANTSFALTYAPQIVAATTFNYRIIPSQPMFYPRSLYITAISSSGTSTVVTLSVTHNLTAGQRVVFSDIESMYGMVEIAGLRGLITAVSTANNTVTVDIDSSAFTAFAYPLTAAAATAHTQPQLIPFGDGVDPTNTVTTSSTLAGAKRNLAVRGMLLGGGANGPAGQNGDVIRWKAWKAEQIQTSYYS